MENIFSLILFISTSVTGFLWCIEKSSFLKKNIPVEGDYNVNNPNLTKKNPKKAHIKEKWMSIGASVFPMLAIVLTVRSFIYEPFHIPSGSMMPTLLAGDFIIVEKFSYNIKDPIYRKTLITIGHPKRGDVVVFKCPKSPYLNYIKRIIGIPGDRVTYDPIAKKITIQPNYMSSPSENHLLPITYSNIEKSKFVHNIFDNYKRKWLGVFFQFFTGGGSKDNFTGMIERKETLGATTHSIVIMPTLQEQFSIYYRQQNQPISTWIVPSRHYFMMGDNRDNSSDSRYWGFVPEENLIGKAKAIWISLEKQEGKWPSGIRLNRIGKIR